MIKINLLKQLKKIKLPVDGYNVFSATIINGEDYEIQIEFPEITEILYKLSEDISDEEREKLWEESNKISEERALEFAKAIGAEDEYCWCEHDYQGLLDIRFGKCEFNCCGDEDIVDIDLDEEDLLFD